MALVIKGSTSGQVTIDVPAEAGTRAINFPAVSGNILTDGAALPAIDGSALTGLAGGTIVKIAEDEITAVSDGSGTFQDTGLEVTITPASTSNKILLLATGSVALSHKTCAWRFTQNGTAVGIGDTPASNTARQRTSWKTTITDLNGSQNFVGSCILSPNSTSALTYKVQIESASDQTWRINQSWNFSNSSDASHAVTSSYLYAIELDGSNTTIST